MTIYLENVQKNFHLLLCPRGAWLFTLKFRKVISIYKVLVTDYDFPDLNLIEEKLSNAGIRMRAANCESSEEIISIAKGEDIDVLIVQYAPINKKVFAALPHLKAVIKTGIGYDNINVYAASKYKVCVMNVEDYCEEDVANHTIALIMAINRKITILNKNVKKGEWNIHSVGKIPRLRNSVLGLIGFGKIASKIAKRMETFELKILFFDPYIDNKNYEVFENTHKEKFDRVIRKSDILSIHTPLKRETKHMIGKSEFEKMKKTAYIINTSRGAIIDEEALISALNNQEIAGAALDVLEQEPITDKNKLKKFENVILTPHAGWYSEESMRQLKIKIANQIIDVLNGEKPNYLINDEIWDDYCGKKLNDEC